MDEFALIEKLFRPLAAEGALDLEDDAAILTPPPGMDLVLTKDAIVEGVHFRAEDPARRIAQKLVRVNLSDLAAKGAKPLGYLLAAAFGRDIDLKWQEEFASGLKEDQEQFGWSLYGGDTVGTPGPQMFSLTAIGTVPKGQTILRAGAIPGDDVFVTGTIGDAGLGLRFLTGTSVGDQGYRQILIDRYQLPCPRVSFGQGLRGIANAAVDISDGLVADAGHLAKVGGVALDIQLDAVPLSDAAKAVTASESIDVTELITCGDDYELLFTADPARRDEIDELGKEHRVPVSRIGSVLAGDGVRILATDGSEIQIESKGYTHFHD